jgi:hypothetical protein
MWGLAVLLVSAFEAFPENTSPAPPQITNPITFDGSENHFVIPGNAGDANGYTVDRTFHAVLVSNLGVSFDVAAMAGNESTGHEGRDGPMISYECDEFPIKVPLSSNSRERYFTAIRQSGRKDTESERVYSPWTVYANTDGVPIAVSTADDADEEDVYYKAVYLSPGQVVCDVSFSLANAAGARLSITRNEADLLLVQDLANAGTIPGGVIVSGIEEAIEQATEGVTRLLIRNDRLFHVFVLIPDYQESDSIAVKVIDADNEVLGEGQFYPAHDMGIRGIVTTIDTLLRIPADTDNPIFPQTLESYEGIPTARLLATAMVNLSLAHASPRPLANERNNGIFTDYIQFMDTICRTWSSAGIAGAEKGLPRLRKIHEQVLETNLGEIVDPVQVVNRGATAEYGQPVKKRKNYAFYEGYARLDCDIAVPEYAADAQPGGGVMFRVSENVELYAANHPDSANMFDEPFLQGAESSRRIIFEADDSLLSKVTIDGEGLWVKGMDPSKGEHTYYIGISPVRLPIQTPASTVEIGEPFVIAAERGAPSDPVGTVIGGPERSVVRVYELVEHEGWADTLRGLKEPGILLHGQSRVLEYDSLIFTGDSLSFFAIPTNIEDTGKIVIQTVAGLLVDTSRTVDEYVAGAIEWYRGVRARIFEHPDLVSRTVAIRDAVDGKYFVPIEDGQVFSATGVAIEKDDTKWLPDYLRLHGRYRVTSTEGVRMNRSSSLDPTQRLEIEATQRELDWSDFYDEVVGPMRVETLWPELKYSRQVENLTVHFTSEQGTPKTEQVYFDMKSNYDRTYDDVKTKLCTLCECLTGTAREECKAEAESLTELYFVMWTQFANHDESYGIRKGHCQNKEDVKSGWMCFQWAFWTQALVGKRHYQYLSLSWSSVVDLSEYPAVLYFDHSWISVENEECNATNTILHLDPWAGNSIHAYTTQEHVQETGYGERNFIGKIGLPRGAAEGVVLDQDGNELDSYSCPYLECVWKNEKW